MKVVLSNASHAWGGVHRVTETLARGLQARGHEVVVFGRPASMLEERMRGVAPFEGMLSGMDLHPATLWRARAALSRHRPDVVVALMKKDVRLTAPVAWAMGIPVVVRHANDQRLKGGPYGRFLYGTVPALHVTNAEATRRTILASAPWLAPERVRVIHNGIDPRPFETAEPLALDLPADAVRIGYAGSFEPRKGLPVLGRAWHAVAAAVPNANLLLAGKGSQEDEMRRVLAGAPRVHWLGYRADVPRVMRSLDVLVLPSYVEGAPNVVQEAMCAGLAIVATAVSGTPELVRGGAEALLVPPGDADALARALIAVSSDAELRARLAAAGHERIRAEFTLDAMLDAYEQALSDVISRRR